MHLFYFLNYTCVSDLPGDYIFIRMHSNRPTVHSIYIFDTVQNAFQLVDFTRQHYFERALLDSGLMHGNILATNNLFGELHCSCQTGVKGKPDSSAWYRRRCTGNQGTATLSHQAWGAPPPCLVFGRGWSMRGEQRCRAVLHLIARSWKRRLALSCSSFSHPCPQGGQKNLCRAETRAVLSWDVSLHFICFRNMFHIYGISSTAGQKCLKILNLHFYNTALVIFPHLQKNRFLFKEL